VNLEILEEKILELSKSIQISQSDLENFDGTFSTVIPIAEKLIGRALNQNERTSKNLGELFQSHPTILFLRNSLKGEAKSLKTLAQDYKEEYRNNEPFDNCLKELKAALLLGTIARIIIQNEERPLLVPKLHVFFTQGQELYGCLSTGRATGSCRNPKQSEGGYHLPERT